MDSNSREAQIIASAFHEAGHAVRAMMHGYAVGKLVVSFNRPGDGFIVRQNPDLSNPIFPGETYASAQSAWEYALQKVKQEMSIYLAGPIAESEFVGGEPLRLRGAEQDKLICQGLIGRIENYYDFYREYAEITPVCGNRILNHVHTDTKAWIKRSEIWNKISLLAQAASVKGVLEERHLRFLVGQAPESGQLALDLY